MKRFAAIITAFCLLAVQTAFAADIETDTAAQTADISFLSVLGFFSSDDEFDGTAEMTRAEFAGEAIHLLNDNAETYDGLTSPYADVDEYTDNGGAILMLTALGVFRGGDDGCFMPDDTIAAPDAATAVTRLLGYSMKLSEKSFARIKADLTVSNGSLTWNDSVSLFEKALETNCLERDGYGGDETYTAKRTLLQAQFGIEDYEGKVTANRFTALESTDEPGDNHVMIDGIAYKTTFDFSSLLGYCVTYYVRESERGEAEVIYARPTAQNKVTVIDADDLIEFKNGVYKYDVNGKTRTEKVPGNADIIYNGRSDPSYTQAQMAPKFGSVTLLEYGGKTETVVIEDIRDEIVSAVSDSKIYFRSGNSIDIDEVSFVSMTDADGDGVNISAVAEGLVISIKRSADGEYADMTVSSRTVSGVVSAVSEDEVTVGDESFKISPYCEDGIEKVTPGNNYVLTLNAYGRAVKMKSRSSSEIFAYFIELTPDTFGGSKIGLLTENNELKAFKTAVNVTVNGSQSNSVESTLTDRQLIKVKINDDDEITKIETAVNAGAYTGLLKDNEALDGLRISSEGNQQRFKEATATFNGQTPMDANTKVFFVKSSASAGITTDNFYTGVIGYLTNDDRYTYTAYSTESGARAADAVVIYDCSEGGSIGETAPISMVLSRRRAVDEDGIACSSVTLLKGNNELNFILDDKINPDAVPGASGDDTRTYKLSKGDAVRFATDMTGRIATIKMVYDVADDGNGKGYSYANPATGSLTDLKFRMICAPLYDIDNGVMRLSKVSLDGGDDVLRQTDLENYRNYSSCRVYVCEKGREGYDVKVGSIAEAIAYRHSPGEYSTVIVSTQYGTPTLIVLYQGK